MNLLFKNDGDAYKEQIKILNSMSSFDEAINYINNQLKNKFEWKLKGTVEKKFIRLIERRYLFLSCIQLTFSEQTLL